MHIALCRPGSEALLAAELAAVGAIVSGAPDAPAGGAAKAAAATLAAPGAPPGAGVGWLAWRPERPGREPPPGALAFERQRLLGAAFVPAPPRAPTGPLAEHLLQAALPSLRSAPAPLTLHAYAADPTGERSASAAAAALARRLREGAGREAVPLAPAGEGSGAAPPTGPGAVWQVCLVEGGAWWCVMPAAALADPWPGGVHRMTRAAAAPSRSVLKIEEALEVLGRQPRARERVIDLGAAPGGWSYAFLQRGCRVLAVDHGPLKLPALDDLPGELTHLRSDGLRLRPPPGWLPVDWLLSDMLVPPGVCLGLLRKWLEAGWARRFIVNVKLPQREPVGALAPIRAYLAGVAGLSWRMRQLYHDRREVTVMGTLTAGGTSNRGAPNRAAPKAAKTSKASQASSGSKRTVGAMGPAGAASAPTRPPARRPSQRKPQRKPGRGRGANRS